MSILRRGRMDFPFLSGNNEYLVDRPARPSPGVFSVGCDQSAVAVRIGAGLAAGEFTLLLRFGTASRTLHCECLLWAGFFFHGEMMLRNPNSGRVNLDQADRFS